MAKTVQIQEMTEDDHHRVSEILCSCYGWLAEREGFTGEQLQFLLSERGSVETVRQESKSQTYLVAFNDRTLVGVVAVKGNEITRLYVEPEYHHQGIGRMLLEEAENVIRRIGLEEVTFGARETAVPFYEAMGMTVVGHKAHRAQVFARREVVLMKKSLGVE